MTKTFNQLSNTYLNIVHQYIDTDGQYQCIHHTVNIAEDGPKKGPNKFK